MNELIIMHKLQIKRERLPYNGQGKKRRQK